MCQLCENFQIGDRLPSMLHAGECPICGDKFKVVQQTPLWICDIPHSHNGSLLHLTDQTYVCKCGSKLSLGFYCQGIDGGELFTKCSESLETEHKSMWEKIRSAFKIYK
jgi:C4-type Zn-finger protein